MEVLNGALVESTLGRTMVVFYNLGGDQLEAFLTDWIPELDFRSRHRR